jgi:hypothetical protein
MRLVGVFIALLATAVPTVADTQSGPYEFCVTRVLDSRTEVFKVIIDLPGGLVHDKESARSMANSHFKKADARTVNVVDYSAELCGSSPVVAFTIIDALGPARL